MKILAINGSPHKKGNTYHALKVACDKLEESGIETEILYVGLKPLRGCTACGMCAKNQDQKCILKGDDVNEWIAKMVDSDGFILGSPVYFAAIAGTMKSFLDRAFYVQGSNGGLFRHKVGATIAAVRRAGEVTTFNQLNNYILYAEMMMPGSNYWNVIHGRTPGEVLQDDEGVQTIRVMASNMAWLLQSLKTADIKPPVQEMKTWTHFIR